MTKRLSITRVEFAEGQLSGGTKVFLSDGSQLDGVVVVEQHAEMDTPQTITVKCIKGFVDGASANS